MTICMMLQHSNYVTVTTGAPTPSGIFYVAAALRQAGHTITWVEFADRYPTVEEVRGAVTARLMETKVDVFMCGSLFGGWKEFRDISEGTKLAAPHTIFVGGGGLFTYSPIEAMRLCPSCDFGVRGEGEIVSVNLVEAISGGGGSCQTASFIVPRSAVLR